MPEMINDTPHGSLAGRLKERDAEHIFPVVDCPKCGMIDAPYGISCLPGGEEFITRWYCLNCSHSTLERPKIKGWCSLLDLENTNWDSEL